MRAAVVLLRPECAADRVNPRDSTATDQDSQKSPHAKVRGVEISQNLLDGSQNFWMVHKP